MSLQSQYVDPGCQVSDNLGNYFVFENLAEKVCETS
jgi:hypothetical protein